MTARHLLYSALLILISLWLGCTVLVNFLVVPAIFRNISQFFEAGELGVYLFTRLNMLELVVASFILGLFSLVLSRNQKAFPLFIASLIIFLLALTYFSWLGPKIATLTEIWKWSETGKIVPTFDVQSAHQYYHRLYIALDTLKILILLFLMITLVGKKEWTA